MSSVSAVMSDGSAPEDPKKIEAVVEEKSHDPIEETIGGFGKWQLWICLALSLLKFPVAWHQLAIVFLAPPVQFWCFPDGMVNATHVTDDQCNVLSTNEPCTEWYYDRSVFDETIITQWNLVCDKGQMANVAQTVFMFGVLLGNVLFGMVADKYGRKLPLLCSIVLQVFAGVGTAFIPWFPLHLVFRFLDAVATGGEMITSFVVCMEIIGHKWRTLVSTMYHIPFALGHAMLSGVAYIWRDWRDFQLAISLPTILLLSYWWIIPESPRWLLAVGKEKEAVALLEKAAVRNNVNPAHVVTGLRSCGQQSQAMTQGTMLDLFRTPNMRTKTLCIYFNWFVCGLCFYGLVQYMGQIGGNIFLNITISGLLEIPGAFGCIYLMEKFGRRKTLAASQFVAGVACLLIMAVPLGPEEVEWPKIILASLGCLGMSVSFPTVYLYSGELFPTVVRNVGVGSASMCARMGSMVAPFIASIATLSVYYPPLIFGVIPVIGASLCYFLPETVNTILPDTLEEGERIRRIDRINETK